MSAGAHAAVQAVWRIASARLIAGLTRLGRDVGLAEDLAQDARRRSRARSLPLLLARVASSAS